MACRCLLSGLALGLIEAVSWMPMAVVRSAPVCTINGTVESCEARLVEDVLIVRRTDGSQIQTKRLGRCGEDRDAQGVTRRCNVRISLPDDFVYGLQLVQPQGVVTLTSPTLMIRIEGVSRDQD